MSEANKMLKDMTTVELEQAQRDAQARAEAMTAEERANRMMDASGPDDLRHFTRKPTVEELKFLGGIE